MKKIIFSLVCALFLLSFVSAENVSIMYGQNSSGAMIPLQTTDDGTLKMEMDLMNITAGNIAASGNLSLGEKITFALGETIDNIVDGWIRITGGLNVTSNNFSLGGKLLSNDNGTLKWGGIDVDTNMSILYGTNSSGSVQGLSVDSSGILNMNVVGVASDIWEVVGGVVRSVSNRDVNISGNLNVSGNGYFGGNLQIMGNISGGSPVKIIGGLDVSGEVNITQNLSVTGNIAAGDIERSSCPEGWVLVPGNSNFTGRDFCVMKYEVSQDSTTKLPVSVVGGTPWVSLSWHDAKVLCSTVDAHLCTNGEATTIARNIEQQIANWQGGVVGTGCMYGGHMDNNPANALATSTDDDSYSGTTDTAGEAAVCPFDTSDGGKASRRTFNLSNGEVIWDFSGNVWEWTDSRCTSGDVWDSDAAWDEWTSADVVDLEKYLAGPLGSYTSSNGVGKFYGCTADGNAFIRGGGWNNGVPAGAFALSLTHAPSGSVPDFGFRCCR